MSSGQLSNGESIVEHPLSPNGAQVLHEWHKLRKGFRNPANLVEAEGSVNTLLKSFYEDYDPERFPNLAHQLVKICTRPCTFNRMPEDFEDVNSLLHEHQKHIAGKIDLPPEIVEEILSPEFWEELLTVCYSSFESGNDSEIDIRPDDYLPIIPFPNEDRADGTKPNDNAFLYRACSQVILVFAGRTDFQWFNLDEQSTGDVSRLRALVLRLQPRLPWVQVDPGCAVQISSVASDDESESESDSDEIKSEKDYQCVEMDQRELVRCQETEEYLPRASQHPTRTFWRDRDDVNGVLWLPPRDSKRPGFYHKLGPNDTVLVSISKVHESDDAIIQCFKPMCEVVGWNCEVEIDYAWLLASFKTTLDHMKQNFENFNDQLYDPQSVCSRVYRVFYKYLEQMLFESGRRLNYKAAFDVNWASVSKGQSPSESSVVFLFPYDSTRSQMVAKAKIVATENDFVRMFVTFSEVGETGRYYSDPTPEGILRLEIFGPQGLKLLRKCIERVTTGQSQEEEFETSFFRSPISIDVNHEKKPHVPDPSDEGDMRNFKEITGLLITAVNNSQFDIRITTSPSSKRVSTNTANPYYVVEQGIELTARACWSKSKISVGITRILTERKRRPQFCHNHLGPIKATDIKLSIKVRSIDDSAWPVQDKHGGVEHLAYRYLIDNNIFMGQCRNLLKAFINGGNALLSCTEGSHWERCFYLERADTLNIHIVDCMRFLGFITGGSIVKFELQSRNTPKKLVWTGKVDGDEMVPSKNIRITMYPEKNRHTGCGGAPGFPGSEKVEYNLLTIHVQVEVEAESDQLGSESRMPVFPRTSFFFVFES